MLTMKQRRSQAAAEADPDDGKDTKHAPEPKDTRARVTEPLPEDDRVRLGELLLSEQGLSPADLAAALNLQQTHGRRLGTILVAQGLLDAHSLTRALGKQLGLPTVDVRREKPTAEALAIVPEDLARQYNMMPLRVVDGVLDIAVADATDPGMREALAALPVQVVNVMLATPADVESSLQTHYRLVSSDDAHVKVIWAAAAAQGRNDVARNDEAPIIQLVNKLVQQALRDRASDIHIEPTDGRVRIRFRIDGALREALSLPSSTAPELISRIKIMADMNIVERRRPQDGQFQIEVDGVNLDIRVATGATIWGETAVLRLLDKRQSILQLGDLGMPADAYARYLSIARRPYGMILCSGLSGSGKTTTLYATLSDVARDELNVMTIEDPVEYVLPSINQMQINHATDVTFASGLKLILRQDPDIILVGEIRDTETANIAVRAALAGHLVMSSMHATDATSALLRVIEMGVEPYLAASSIAGVVGQRLVRRICPSCAAPHQPTAAELHIYEQLGGPPKEQFVRGLGCNYCHDTGFRERIGVYEVLEVTDEVRQLLGGRARPAELRHLAIQQGMRTMGTEAAQLVAADVTTIDEVLRNVHVG